MTAYDFCEEHGRESIYPVRSRKAEVFKCGRQVYWGAGTIMRKTTTPHEKWAKIWRMYCDNPETPISVLAKTTNLNWRTARRLRNLIRNNKEQSIILFGG